MSESHPESTFQSIEHGRYILDISSNVQIENGMIVSAGYGRARCYISKNPAERSEKIHTMTLMREPIDELTVMWEVSPVVMVDPVILQNHATLHDAIIYLVPAWSRINNPRSHLMIGGIEVEGFMELSKSEKVRISSEVYNIIMIQYPDPKWEHLILGG